MTTIKVIDCLKRTFLNTCPTCGRQAPDWCGDDQPTVVEPVEEVAPVVPTKSKKVTQ
jgi:hypothetical protein